MEMLQQQSGGVVVALPVEDALAKEISTSSLTTTTEEEETEKQTSRIDNNADLDDDDDIRVAPTRTAFSSLRPIKTFGSRKNKTFGGGGGGDDEENLTNGTATTPATTTMPLMWKPEDDALDSASEDNDDDDDDAEDLFASVSQDSGFVRTTSTRDDVQDKVLDNIREEESARDLQGEETHLNEEDLANNHANDDDNDNDEEMDSASNDDEGPASDDASDGEEGQGAEEEPMEDREEPVEDTKKDDDDDMTHVADKGDPASVADEEETNAPSSSTELAADEERQQQPEEKKAAAAQPPPLLDEASLLDSTDHLFLQVTDVAQVKFKEFCQSLQAEYQVTKLPKPFKAAVKKRIMDLVDGTVQPLQQNNDAVSDDEEDEASEEEEEEESVAGDDDSDFEEELPENRATSKASSRRRKALKTPKSKKSKTSPRSSGRAKKINPKVAALRIRAEQLRKRRTEELRVRNEELQLVQSEEDQERARRIAAKFETDTEDVRQHRLEARLDLLERLDQKRLTVVQLDTLAKASPTPRKETVAPKEEEEEKHKESASESSDDSDDDMELEIVGPQNLAPRIDIKPNALSLLDMADRDDGTAQSRRRRRKPMQASPGQSLAARAALRQGLLHRQRKMGNAWLARELGYRTEKEHVQDCVQAERKKRERTLQHEQERLKANERQQRRERLAAEQQEMEGALGNADEDDDDDEEYKEGEEVAAFPDEEEDEEQAMAKAIAAEQDIADSAALAEEANDDAPDENIADQVIKLAEPTNEDAPNNETVQPNVDKGVEEGESQEEDLLETQAPLPFARKELAAEREKEESVAAPFGNNPSEPMGDVDEGDDAPIPFADDADDDEMETQGDDRLETQAPVLSTVRRDEAETKVDLAPVDEQNEKIEEATAQDHRKDDAEDPTSTVPEESTKDTNEEEAQPKASFNSSTGEGDKASNTEETTASPKKPKGPRNSAWKAMLEKDAAMHKQRKKRKGTLLDDEAEEEEEEEIAGLESFGFVPLNKKKEGEDEDDNVDAQDDDLDDVVDELSDDEGDEDAGDKARMRLAQEEEKERHKDIMRRMREGYDGRRGGIAGGAGTRGVHRFDQLVAADNPEDAKRLGLLNDDEMDSDHEEDGEKTAGDDEEDDEAALLDKMLKDRFLHRSSVDLEENFSGDEEDEDGDNGEQGNGSKQEDDEEKEQERRAKRFAKRARMQRLLEQHGEDEEFTQSRLMDEDTSMREELLEMKNGLVRKRSQTSYTGSSNSALTSNLGASTARENPAKKSKTAGSNLFMSRGGSLALALHASRRAKPRSTFLRSTSTASSETTASFQKTVTMNHVVFQSTSQLGSNSGVGGVSRGSLLGRSRSSGGPPAKKVKTGNHSSSSLWSRAVSGGGFRKTRS